MKWWQKHVKQRPERVAELNKLGFVWERLQPEWNLVLEALVTYASIYGNLLVPQKFAVPYGDAAWPKATWGIRLGKAVYRIRNRGDYLNGNSSWSRRDQLDAIGFVWDFQESRFRKFYDALVAFIRLEVKFENIKRTAALRIPAQYVVPSTKEWPEELWGYKLGQKCVAVRQKGLYVKNNPERLHMLEELGFHLSGNSSLGWLSVVHAAAIYSQLNNRKLDVPSKFVVPAPPRRYCKNGSQREIVGSDDAWPWPGM